MKKENSKNCEEAHCESSGLSLCEKNQVFDAKRAKTGAYLTVVKTQFVREGEIVYAGRFSDAKEAAQVARKLFGNADRELFLVLSLDAKNRPLAIEVAAIGTIDRCLVGMAEIFRHAILACAASIICFHNHPSGNCEASPSDRRVTQRIAQAGELLGIPLLDHIILGAGDTYHSMEESGEYKGRSRWNWNLQE